MSINSSDISSLPVSLSSLDENDEFILVDKSITQDENGNEAKDGIPYKVTLKKISEYLKPPPPVAGQKGKRGDKGEPKGTTGLMGARGFTGALETKVNQSASGGFGKEGPRGHTGEKGDRGEKGVRGYRGIPV